MSYVKKLYFPLQLKSSSRIIKIGTNVFIKRIDDISCQKALGIRGIVYNFDEDGRITRLSHEKGSIAMFALHMPALVDRRLISSRLLTINYLNYVLVVNTLEEAKNFQHALKLINYRTKSGISVGFSYTSGGHLLSFIHPEPYFGKEIFEPSSANVKLLSKIMNQLLKMQGDDKLQLILQKYQYALSSEGLINSQRFLELSIILEMLLLPDANVELSYHFRLRFAKLFSKYHEGDGDTDELYRKGKILYDMRSNIVHKGSDRRIEDNIDILKGFTQRAIRLYLSDAFIFTEKNLDNLCLM
jgi:hypothetical protein